MELIARALRVRRLSTRSGGSVRPGQGWSEGDTSPSLILWRISIQIIPRFRQPRKNTSSEKFERDRAQEGTRLGEYWRSLPSRVTNLHKVSQPKLCKANAAPIVFTRIGIAEPQEFLEIF